MSFREVISSANLLRLGFSYSSIVDSFLEKSLRYDDMINRGMQEIRDNFIEHTGNIPNLKGSIMLISFHYGLYLDLVADLLNKYPHKTLCILIRQQEDLIKLEKFQRIAKTRAYNIQFIQVGKNSYFLRKIKENANKNTIFLAFLDMPNSDSFINNTPFQFMGGTFYTRDGLLRISKKMNIPCYCIASHPNENMNAAELIVEKIINNQDCMNFFEKLIKVRPYLWQRVNSLHHSYESEHATGSYFIFTEDEYYYLYSVALKKYTTVNQYLYNFILENIEFPELLKELTKIIPQGLDEVKRIYQI